MPAIYKQLFAIVFACSTIQAFAANATAQSDESTRVAVVDVVKIFDALDERTDIEADTSQQNQALIAESEKRKADLEALKADLEILPSQGDARQKKLEEIQYGSLAYKNWTEFETLKLTRFRIIRIEEIYRKMLDTIGRVAVDNGYDLVLFKEREVKFAGAKPEQVSALIASRKVVWSSDRLDLTEQVIDRMNAEHRNKKP